ncbi:MAG: tRNA1(Val) (adenine(37)-N6)-methyltransferase [Nitrospirae bacterium]|nr:tRNA1(Val) (adenine(37)-N6)-methyltransferase [Nitrospirota bacterium]
MDVTLDSIRDIKLYQPKRGYRFSVDSLLLYDFVNLKHVKSIGDLGAGSGIVGILLAKKYPLAKVTLFEIQENLVRLAEKNIIINNLENRVKVYRCDLRKLPSLHIISHDFDLLVSNPPYRKVKSGLISDGEEKAIARHEIKLRLHELIESATSLLKIKGRLCMVYHPYRLSELLEVLKKSNLQPKRLRFVYSNISSEAKMFLLEAVKFGKVGLKVERPFYIYNENGSYSDEMIEIYQVKE